MSNNNTQSSDSDYPCSFAFCAHHYKTKAGLKRHYLSHGVKPFRCPYCHLRFGASKALTDHAYTHTGGRPFVCEHEGCGRRFRKAWLLTAHQRKHDLLDLSESSEEGSAECGPTSCSFDTIESVFTQIAAFELPSYFYTKVLPVPDTINRIRAPLLIFG